MILVAPGQTCALFNLGIPAQCSAGEEALLAPRAVLGGQGLDAGPLQMGWVVPGCVSAHFS